ncbi:CU044_2847 family protein [Streptomyces sp. NPDC005017]|uniref:CU044_2847 family protein n=1 Tax=Streptomyces sp. NPDC005017 TaxID=3364706 RepID=UPI00367A4F32
MARFLQVPLGDDQFMSVEVTSQDDEDTFGPVSRRQDAVTRLPESLSDGLDRVRSFSEEVLTRLRSGTRPPDSVQVEFGLKLSAKAGLVIAESTGETHLTVTLQWQRPGGADGPPLPASDSPQPG